jgi:hypothetical protein
MVPLKAQKEIETSKNYGNQSVLIELMLNSVSSASQEEQERTHPIWSLSLQQKKPFKLIFKTFLDKLTFVAMN